MILIFLTVKREIFYCGYVRIVKKKTPKNVRNNWKKNWYDQYF
jgi:hypothetical protein